jgi:toxin ParE1/3/4
MGQINYSDDALADLLALRQYIALHNPSAANRVAARIIQSVNRLQTHPRFGKPGRVAGTRELIIPRFPYSIVYEEDKGDCMVLRVLHQAMQWPAETSADD